MCSFIVKVAQCIDQALYLERSFFLGVRGRNGYVGTCLNQSLVGPPTLVLWTGG